MSVSLSLSFFRQWVLCYWRFLCPLCNWHCSWLRMLFDRPVGLCAKVVLLGIKYEDLGGWERWGSRMLQWQLRLVVHQVKDAGSVSCDEPHLWHASVDLTEAEDLENEVGLVGLSGKLESALGCTLWTSHGSYWRDLTLRNLFTTCTCYVHCFCGCDCNLNWWQTITVLMMPSATFPSFLEREDRERDESLGRC